MLDAALCAASFVCLLFSTNCRRTVLSQTRLGLKHLYIYGVVFALGKMRSQCAAHSIRGLWRGGLFCTLTFLLFQCTLISAIADEDMVRAGEKMAPSEVLLQRAAQPRTHVVIGALAWKDEHSLFLESLRDCM